MDIVRCCAGSAHLTLFLSYATRAIAGYDGQQLFFSCLGCEWRLQESTRLRRETRAHATSSSSAHSCPSTALWNYFPSHYQNRPCIRLRSSSREANLYLSVSLVAFMLTSRLQCRRNYPSTKTRSRRG
ncbi:hypothetical protein F5Y05DRAFT_346782 [Hypoxylon sp. FL0543]|nr:hypothetical protein F5Y05DRAFT_346782 [Hypoxylon sp. FL0543]